MVHVYGKISHAVIIINQETEANWGWSVIAETHGLVLVRYRLAWDTLWTWNPWPTSNTQIRTNLENNPGEQCVFALKLSDGSVPFICNVGNYGWGDGNYLPMGTQPVVKKFTDNTEVAYIMIRGTQEPGADGGVDPEGVGAGFQPQRGQVRQGAFLRLTHVL